MSGCKPGNPGIFAIGDVVAGLPQLAHVAAMAGMVVAAKVAGKPARPVRRDRIPACTYCEPQIGSVGLTEAQAKEQGHEVKVGKFPFSANSKASIVGSHEGFVKVVADAKHGEVLGVHIIGPQATEMIAEAVVAHGAGSDHRGADVHHPRPPHVGGGHAGWLWQRGEHGHQCLSRPSLNMVVSLVNLGRLDYAAALALQQQVCALRQQERIGDVLLLVEHPPVLTLGRNAHREHVVASDELLARRGISLFETNRGGDVTYHGPGQLVGYPILDLRGFAPAAGHRRLPAQAGGGAHSRLCGLWRAYPARAPGAPASGPCPGVRSRRRRLPPWACTSPAGVTSHGFALNVTTDLDDFRPDRALWHPRPRRHQHRSGG